jgi:hypothetical protein
MLHLNSPGTLSGLEEEQLYKVLVLDRSTKDVLAPLLRVSELRRQGVTLHLLIDSDRQPIPDVPAVYYIHPSDENIQRIADDARKGLYDSLYINFSTHIARPALEQLASTVSASGTAAARIANLHDQYNQFIALENGLFSLGLPDTYLRLNDPSAQDTQIESTVSAVVEGLFCVLATMGVVPIIRCPKGGAAEHVAAALDSRLRDALRNRGNIFSEAGAGSTGLSASLQRPLLCLFDRNFELSVVLQHTWTYKPLLHDVLGMHLNRVAVQDGGTNNKSYEVDENDFFWTQYGREQFPNIAEQVEAELSRYKSSVEELNRKAAAGGHDMAMDPNDPLAANTRSLMSAVSSLPELTERKRVIDKHTNLATALLGIIKNRGLDNFYALEEEFVAGKAGIAQLEELLHGPAGTATDKLRAALVWLLTAKTPPAESDCNRIEELLQESGADVAAWAYVKRMRRMNLTGKQQQSSSANLGEGAAQNQLTNLLGSTFGQGLSSLTKGVKSLLAGEQQAAVTVAVEALMEGKSSSSSSGQDGGGISDSYMTFDPKVPMGQGQRASTGPYKEAIVFMIGGGNMLEYESLSCWASRAQPSPKYIVYGATELLNGEKFLAQLSELGRRSGAL